MNRHCVKETFVNSELYFFLDWWSANAIEKCVCAWKLEENAILHNMHSKALENNIKGLKILWSIIWNCIFWEIFELLCNMNLELGSRASIKWNIKFCSCCKVILKYGVWYFHSNKTYVQPSWEIIKYIYVHFSIKMRALIT